MFCFLQFILVLPYYFTIVYPVEVLDCVIIYRTFVKFVGMRSNNKKNQKKTTLNIRREPNHDQRGNIEGGVLQRATDVCQKCSKIEVVRVQQRATHVLPKKT